MSIQLALEQTTVLKFIIWGQSRTNVWDLTALPSYTLSILVQHFSLLAIGVHLWSKPSSGPNVVRQRTKLITYPGFRTHSLRGICTVHEYNNDHVLALVTKSTDFLGVWAFLPKMPFVGRKKDRRIKNSRV